MARLNWQRAKPKPIDLEADEAHRRRRLNLRTDRLLAAAETRTAKPWRRHWRKPKPKDGPRAHGTNPRALGTNPRAIGSNPRAST